MLSIRADPFPIEAVRDLLGLVRALYAARVAEGAGPVLLTKIATIGLDLGAALDLAGRCNVGTLGHAAAWKRAERAAMALGDVVALTDGAQPIVLAAVRRVRSAP